MKHVFLTVLAILIWRSAPGEPVHFDIDPEHTYPSFEADHMGGMSIWRGKFRTTSGTIILDRTAHSGVVDIKIDAASIEFGHEKMNERARSEAMFDVEKFPTASYQGRLIEFRGDVPTAVDGTFTLHGVTKPLRLSIRSFKCRESALNKNLTCGADAEAHLNRADFGIDWGKSLGFDMEVKLAIEVEAIKAN